MTFVQMEALTGWAAKDEWDFEYLGMTNNPFIKANYPHHGKFFKVVQKFLIHLQWLKLLGSFYNFPLLYL